MISGGGFEGDEDADLEKAKLSFSGESLNKSLCFLKLLKLLKLSSKITEELFEILKSGLESNNFIKLFKSSSKYRELFGSISEKEEVKNLFLDLKFCKIGFDDGAKLLFPTVRWPSKLLFRLEPLLNFDPNEDGNLLEVEVIKATFGFVLFSFLSALLL